MKLDKIFSIKRNKDYKHITVTLFGLKLNLKIKTPYMLITDWVSAISAREAAFALEIQNQHSKIFPQFKNCHVGENVILVGCAPTIKYFKPSISGKYITLNKALFLENIKSDYTFVFDVMILETHPGYLEQLKQYKCKKFIGKFLPPERRQFPELIEDEKDDYYRFYAASRKWLPAYNICKTIHTDLTTYPLMDFSSISFSALHFALWTHPKRIYLAGLDTAPTGHFFGQKNSYDFKEMLDGYHRFKEYIDIYYPDVEIVSINPVGLKGLFKDVYTQEYVNEHPELKKENIEIINL